MRKILLLFIASLLVLNCNGGGGGTKPPTIDEQIIAHLSTAWEKFENADFDSAEYYFDQALSLRTGEPGGQLGKGWAKLMNEDSDYLNVETLFESAMTDSSLKNDLLAGLGIVYIDQLLESSSSYVFSHNTDINYQDMLIIQAHSYFYNKQFNKSYESILELTTDYIFDPSESSTWVVDGDTYPSYEGAISALLAKLSDLYKSF